MNYFYITFIAIVFLFGTIHGLFSQQERDIELNAAQILARVDKVLEYPPGLIKGSIKHITPNGKAYSINITANVTKDDFLFTFSNSSRGNQLKVLYKLRGEDIWVYNIPSSQLFHKLGIDKYDSILTTNFFYIDLSNADLQSNYNAKIVGKTKIKEYDAYQLRLQPIFKGGQYGMLTLYVSTAKYIPLRIDFHDRDMAIYKFMTISRVKEKGDKVIPLRYDMMDIRQGTLSILNFYDFDSTMKFNKNIFNSSKLGE